MDVRPAIGSLLILVLAGCPSATPLQPAPDLATPSPADLGKPADLAKAPAPDLAMATLGATVILKDDFYMPAMVTINAGQKVKWSWQAAGAHGVDSVDNTFPDGPIFMGGGATSYEYVFATPGTYDIQCAIHGSAMKMSVLVK